MIIKKELIKRQIAGDTVLVPVGRTVYESNGLFVLNELGNFIWDLLPQVESKEAILDAVLAEYDVDRATAQQDIDAFFSRLEQLGIL